MTSENEALLMKQISESLKVHQMDRAAELLDELLTVARDLTPRDFGLRWRAECHAAAKEFEAALLLADERTELCSNAPNLFSAVESSSIAANMLSKLGRYAEAVERMERALRFARTAGSSRNEPLLFDLGRYQYLSGQKGKAVNTFAVLADLNEAYGADEATLAETYSWLERSRLDD